MNDLIQLNIPAAILIGMVLLMVFVLILAWFPQPQHQRAISTLDSLRKWLPAALVSRWLESRQNNDDKK